MVRIVLGIVPASECPEAFPTSAPVDVAWVTQAVNTALFGCGG